MGAQQAASAWRRRREETMGRARALRLGGTIAALADGDLDGARRGAAGGVLRRQDAENPRRASKPAGLSTRWRACSSATCGSTFRAIRRSSSRTCRALPASAPPILSTRRREPDGLTILFNSWDPLAQVLGDQGMRARYENFEFVGGVGDIRVIYGRSDMIPGGVKKAHRYHARRQRDPRLAQLHQPVRAVAASRPQCARGQAPDDRRLPRRRGRVPGHAARRGQYPFD